MMSQRQAPAIDSSWERGNDLQRLKKKKKNTGWIFIISVVVWTMKISLFSYGLI